MLNVLVIVAYLLTGIDGMSPSWVAGWTAIIWATVAYRSAKIAVAVAEKRKRGRSTKRGVAEGPPVDAPRVPNLRTDT